MKTTFLATLAMTAMASVAAVPVGAQATDAGNKSNATYVAHIHPMNTKATGVQTKGEARFVVTGDNLTISITADGLPPDIEHWQHFHGFTDDKDAKCPAASADANKDGIVDLIETEPAAGTTMVPFDSDPVAMDVAHGTYPKASASGSYTYQETVSLKALTAAFANAVKAPALDLDRRVIFIHGVPATTKLPSTVASLGPIPAHVTLPIACGVIERVSK